MENTTLFLHIYPITDENHQQLSKLTTYLLEIDSSMAELSLVRDDFPGVFIDVFNQNEGVFAFKACSTLPNEHYVAPRFIFTLSKSATPLHIDGLLLSSEEHELTEQVTGADAYECNQSIIHYLTSFSSTLLVQKQKIRSHFPVFMFEFGLWRDNGFANGLAFDWFEEARGIDPFCSAKTDDTDDHFSPWTLSIYSASFDSQQSSLRVCDVSSACSDASNVCNDNEHIYFIEAYSRLVPSLLIHPLIGDVPWANVVVNCLVEALEYGHDEFAGAIADNLLLDFMFVYQKSTGLLDGAPNLHIKCDAGSFFNILLEHQVTHVFVNSIISQHDGKSIVMSCNATNVDKEIQSLFQLSLTTLTESDVITIFSTYNINLIVLNDIEDNISLVHAFELVDGKTTSGAAFSGNLFLTAPPPKNGVNFSQMAMVIKTTDPMQPINDAKLTGFVPDPHDGIFGIPMTQSVMDPLGLRVSRPIPLPVELCDDGLHKYIDGLKGIYRCDTIDDVVDYIEQYFIGLDKLSTNPQSVSACLVFTTAKDQAYREFATAVLAEQHRQALLSYQQRTGDKAISQYPPGLYLEDFALTRNNDKLCELTGLTNTAGYVFQFITPLS
jgi:hypothetical protein